jgi:hypothetical protein
VDGASLTGQAEEQRRRREKGKACVEDDWEASSSSSLGAQAATAGPAQKQALSFKAMVQKVTVPTLADAIEAATAVAPVAPGTPRAPGVARPRAPSAGSEVEMSSWGSEPGSSGSGSGSRAPSCWDDDSPGPSSRPYVSSIV